MADGSLYNLAVQTFRGGQSGYPGTGCLIGPGCILTALHCVFSTEANAVVPFDCRCDVRLWNDVKLANPQVKSWRVERSDIELEKTTTKTWREAKLIWPPPGLDVEKLPDIAILNVAQGDWTDLMYFQRPQLRTFTPTEAIYCQGFGFPRFAAREGKLGSSPVAELEEVDGRLSGIARFSDSMRGFTVQGRTPAHVEGWKGLSGGPVFHLDSGALFGVFGRFEQDAIQRGLAVTTFSQIEDENFWNASGLSKPLTGRTPPWRRQQPTFRAADFLYLFDRGPQLTDFRRRTMHLVDGQEVPPLIAVIVGRIADIPDELVRRFEKEILIQQFGDAQAYQATPTIDWPKEEEFESPPQAAMTFLQDVASLVKFHLPNFDAPSLRQLHARFTEEGRLGYRTYLRASRFNITDMAILKELFYCWSGLGSARKPPVLFIVVHASNEITSPDVDQDLQRIRREIASCTPRQGLDLMTIVLRPLVDCEHGHFADWERALAEQGCDDPIGYVQQLKQELAPFETFPLMQLQQAITRL